MGEGFPCLEGPLAAQIRGEPAERFPCLIGRGSLPCSRPGLPCSTPSEAPSGPCWSWGRRRKAGAEQERQVGGALWDRRSQRGAEGVCPTHSTPGSLLGSQVGSPAL